MTLSLKPARFEIQENNILIDACTKVARETLQKAENSELFYKALEALDLPYTHIKIN